ncbi:hypothetical protein [Bacillus sp. 165]|uniref:hypothetical protein n=1 Tax=Bacillus sp. 165 TaxID=1529117 RepID=UPI001AD9AF48|nr:hypothetical protein [Bacillus sp. 165]MBO9130727.1 hypothetical protein [Bacillus sp. 165]
MNNIIPFRKRRKLWKHTSLIIAIAMTIIFILAMYAVITTDMAMPHHTIPSIAVQK